MTKLSVVRALTVVPALSVVRASTVVPAAVALVLLGAPAGPALASSGPSPVSSPQAGRPEASEPTELAVAGRGVVEATPDVMRVNVGVEARRDRAGEAFAAAKAAAAKLTDALLAAGVAKADMRTNDLALGAEYEQYPKVVGYRASQGVEALLRDLSAADAVVDAVAGVGEEVRLNGVSFEISKADALVKTARAAAYRDALAKAQQYATLTGRRVGRVVKIEEEGDASPSRFAMAEKSSSINPGHGSIGVTIRAVYELI